MSGDLLAGFIAGILFAVVAIDFQRKPKRKLPDEPKTTLTVDHIQRGKDWLKDN